jgi:hypothetical protein
MPYYTGCRVTVAVPEGYERTDALVQHLESKLPGVGVEVVPTDKATPEIREVEVSEGSPLRTARVSEAWVSVTEPVTHQSNEGGRTLKNVASGALQEFLRQPQAEA